MVHDSARELMEVHSHNKMSSSAQSSICMSELGSETSKCGSGSSGGAVEGPCLERMELCEEFGVSFIVHYTSYLTFVLLVTCLERTCMMGTGTGVCCGLIGTYRLFICCRGHDGRRQRWFPGYSNGDIN
jgi:hypothetical protein